MKIVDDPPDEFQTLISGMVQWEQGVRSYAQEDRRFNVSTSEKSNSTHCPTKLLCNHGGNGLNEFSPLSQLCNIGSEFSPPWQLHHQHRGLSVDQFSQSEELARFIFNYV